MSDRFKLRCEDSNERHVTFRMFDPHGASCGLLTILSDDCVQFVSKEWNGTIEWSGHNPMEWPKP